MNSGREHRLSDVIATEWGSKHKMRYGRSFSTNSNDNVPVDMYSYGFYAPLV